MKNRLLFTFLLAVLTDTGEGSLPPRSMSSLDLAALAILGVSPTDAASWGEVQAQRLFKVYSPYDFLTNARLSAFDLKRLSKKFPANVTAMNLAFLLR